jgi:hypothetical protein
LIIFSRYYIEQKTGGESGGTIPSKPSFDIARIQSDSSYDKIKVTWKPNVGGNPGSHFYVQHRKKGEPKFSDSQHIINEDAYEVSGLDPNEQYEIRVVSVDGENNTPSEVQYYNTADGGLK